MMCCEKIRGQSATLLSKKSLTSMLPLATAAMVRMSFYTTVKNGTVSEATRYDHECNERANEHNPAGALERLEHVST